MVVAGDTVTVTAEKNFYVEKYEIEYNDGGGWKLYQEVTGSGWDAFSFDFTSDTAGSVTFRIKAYAEMFDEEQDEWVVGLIDTSEEFIITWTSNEHVHIYGAIPNGKDETNHWKECTDPACPNKTESVIELAPHKAIGGNCQTEAACECTQMLLGNHVMSNTYTQKDGQHFRACLVIGCTYTVERADCSGGTATETERAVCEVCGNEYGELKSTEGTPDPTPTPDPKPGLTPIPTPTPDKDGERDGLSSGAIVGIVIGSVAVVGIGGFALFWFVIKKKSLADLIAIFKK